MTVLQASKEIAVASESLTFTASVQNANRNVPITSGRVKFVVDSPTHIVLGKVNLNKNGEAGITTDKLTKVGTYLIEADYIPGSSRMAKSVSALESVVVNPLTATSFLVMPGAKHGHLGQPLSFTVTALDAQRQPVTNYTGTVTFSSPTDSVTILPRGLLVSLNKSAEGEGIDNFLPLLPQTTGLASFPVQQYTFTPADRGTHNFDGGITFGKAGAEVLRVTQSNDAKVFGKTTFSIG